MNKNSNKYKNDPILIFNNSENLITHLPHDITFSANGKYLVIVYSSKKFSKKVVLYTYDKKNYKIYSNPKQIIECDKLEFGIPKGINFSSDNKYFSNNN